MPSTRLLWLLPLFLLSACGNGGADQAIQENSTPARETVALPAAPADEKDSLADDRKVIRTAGIECHVPDVLAAVTRLERTVLAVGGTIEESNISNNGDVPETVAYTADSVKLVRNLHVSAFLTLRVPVELLDSVVNSIPDGATTVESRRLAQTDVTLKYMANELMNKPGQLGSTTKALELATDASDAIEVQRYADDRKERVVNRHIENLRILNNVAYSTLTVKFTQPRTIFTQIVVNPESVFKASFGTRLAEAMRNGTVFFQELLILLLNIWPLLLIIAGTVWIVRYVRRQRPRPVSQ